MAACPYVSLSPKCWLMFRINYNSIRLTVHSFPHAYLYYLYTYCYVTLHAPMVSTKPLHELKAYLTTNKESVWCHNTVFTNSDSGAVPDTSHTLYSNAGNFRQQIILEILNIAGSAN